MDSTGSVLCYSHLSYQVKTKVGGAKVLVDDVSVEIKAGQLLAIMVRFASCLPSRVPYTILWLVYFRDHQVQVS
jgi:hypothetical protein